MAAGEFRNVAPAPGTQVPAYAQNGTVGQVMGFGMGVFDKAKAAATGFVATNEIAQKVQTAVRGRSTCRVVRGTGLVAVHCEGYAAPRAYHSDARRSRASVPLTYRRMAAALWARPAAHTTACSPA